MQPFDDIPTGSMGIISDLDGPSRIPLDDWLGRQRPTWQRLTALASVGLALIVLVVGIVHPAWWGVATPSPPNPIVSNSTSVVIVASDVSTGLVTVNGTTHVMYPGIALTVHPGQNSLALLAPPFAAIHCLLLMPPTPGNGLCESNYRVAQGSGYAPVINLDLNITNLPESPDHVFTAIQQMLASDAGQVHATVLPGQHYGTGSLDSTNAQPHLAATLLNASLIATPMAQSDCGFTRPLVVCPVDFTSLPSVLPDLHWLLRVNVVAGWYFRNPTTGHVSTVQLSVAGNSPDSLIVDLVYAPTGNWSVDVATPSAPSVAGQLMALNCHQGAATLSALLVQGSSISSSSTPPATGCTLTVQQNGTWNFIERFGVLLAADTSAQQKLPNLPLATPDEIKAVAQGS